MYDPAVQLVKVATIAGWVGAVAVLFTAWLVGLFGDWRVAVLLGFTHTGFLAAAVTLSVRGYAARILDLVRACQLRREVSPDDGAELRPVK